MTHLTIVAEAGVNHDGDPVLAREMVQVAARAGADVVKFQTFAADRLATPGAPKAPYQLETTGPSGSQLEMLRALELEERHYRELFRAAGEAGIEFLSTPFDAESADLLARVGVRRFKIPSGELTHHALLRHVAGLGRPVLLSTGMAYLGEVERAVRVLTDAGCRGLVLLHCTSSYPTPAADANLRAIETLRAAFGLPVGYSDHTEGMAVACAAVALGACVIEKHFTLDRARRGPDHRASLDPAGLEEFVRALREVEAALGDGIKRPAPSELGTRDAARKSLVAVRDLAAGERVGASDLAARRPGTGIPPTEVERVVGRRLARPVAENEVLEWKHLD